MGDNTDPAVLAELSVEAIRRENQQVDNELSSLEDDVDDLEDEVADAEDERDTYKERAEKAEKLLEEFEQAERKKQIKRIKQANEALDADKEVDLSTLEDANVAHLETTADMVERFAEASEEGVSNTDDEPDLGNIGGDGTGTDGDSEDAALDEMAEEMGLGKSWRKAKNDGFDGGAFVEGTGIGGAAEAQSEREASAVERIAEAIEEGS